MASPKGFAPWRPQKATQVYLREVQEVINLQRGYWPLTQRYWLYRLIAIKGWIKADEYGEDTKGKNLNNILGRGRRAGLIPWDAVASSRGSVEDPLNRSDAGELAGLVRDVINRCQFDRQEGQCRRVVLWMETEGMLPLVESTAHRYGATILAGKGFDVVGRKYDFARVIADQGNVLILHCGDLDKSGHTLFSALEEDLQAFIRDMGGMMELNRIALTEEQASDYGLQTTPASAGLNEGNHGKGFTSRVECQLEALDAPDIISIIESAFESELDMDLLNERIAHESIHRANALDILMKEVAA
jgi:hypothetical protein